MHRDPAVLKSEGDDDWIRHSHDYLDEAWEVYGYRKFYTEALRGQLIVLRPDYPPLHHYERPKSREAIENLEFVTISKMYYLLWVAIPLLAAIAFPSLSHYMGIAAFVLFAYVLLLSWKTRKVESSLRNRDFMKSWILPLALYLIFPVLVAISLGTQPTQPTQRTQPQSQPVASVSKPVATPTTPEPVRCNNCNAQQRENARIMKLVDDWLAHPEARTPPQPTQEEPQAQPAPQIVRIDVRCDSCQSYGTSVADAISTALQQSDKFDYAYLHMLVDTHVVVTERDGSVYVDLPTGTDTRRITQNIATFRNSSDMLDAKMIADAIYA